MTSEHSARDGELVIGSALSRRPKLCVRWLPM
jgi:hypothetical protein